MLTLAWDIDDVLNDLMMEWFSSEWKRKHPECRVRYEDLFENPPHRILNISEQDYHRSLDDFRGSAYTVMHPVEEIKNWFLASGHKFRHVALTATSLHFAGRSAEWTLNNFGKWIRTYHVIPSYRTDRDDPVYDTNKCDFLRWIKNVDVLIDDNEKNVGDAVSEGIKGVLFPRPWNSKRAQGTEGLIKILNDLG